MARLVYIQPRFAILDECSSAVTREMEHRLYRHLLEHKISYITIAHRPALRAYHDRILSIGDGKQGSLLGILPARPWTLVRGLDRSAQCLIGSLFEGPPGPGLRFWTAPRRQGWTLRDIDKSTISARVMAQVKMVRTVYYCLSKRTPLRR
jgi:hypothetical protein